MTFNVEEFKEIADKIPNFKSLPNEGRYRTAIGRYYYYTFLKIRDIILEVDEREEIRDYFKTGKSHHLVRVYLSKLGDILNLDILKEISSDLYNLHRIRKLADYNTDRTVKYIKVKIARKLSYNIIKTLNTLEYNGVIGFENILKHLKKIGEEEGDEYKYFPRINQLG
ncbi:hypothetical protein MFS40622_1153 [Methanocaldococcus sp. FS406-22]|uniref:hypothetical protein n=1 Tax=Methanocaldococcus sp. (strain FS406-22) TaxID=644281 RepID=UPI0001BF2FB2|nr:hypothetical protein [Methanocaldococcus sp. FS406-22]ADC69832.1 hypothetical protein MFS40622_1153 [Methanocaldococcus sp. FS406-22]